MSNQTVGLEFEFLNASLSNLANENRTGWKVETDGSVRHNSMELSWIDNGRFFQRESEHGGEIISPILEFNHDIWSRIIPVTELLYGFGEVSKAANSIHIHYGIQKISTKKLAKLFSWFKENESIFFNVAAPGTQVPRGIFNDFIYYRPIVSPQWALSSEENGGYYRPSLGKIELCTNRDMLAYAAGRQDVISRKWVAPRYCGINYVSILTNGTLEFRMFNFTTDFIQVKAWIMMIVGFMSLVRKDVYTNSVEEMVLASQEDCEASTKEIDKVLEKLCPKKIYENINMEPILTHTRGRVDWSKNELSPEECLREQPRSVRNPHPMDLLEPESFCNPIYLY